MTMFSTRTFTGCGIARLLFLFLSFGLENAVAQLYVVTGSPTPKEDINYALALWKVKSGGSLELTASLADGTYWIASSYDWRKMLILPASPDTGIRVLDFDKAAVTKSCAEPGGPIGGLVDQWLIDSPSKGPVFVEYLIGTDPLHGVLRGMLLDTSIACDASFISIDPGETWSYASSGTAGLMDTGGGYGMHARYSGDGRISTWVSSVTTYFDIPIPESLLAGLSHPGGAINVNNEKVMVVSASDGEWNRVRSLFFRKSDQTWGRVPVVGWERGFGNIIAVAEAQSKDAKHPESAGRASWRNARSPYGPHMRGKFDDAQVVYPGKLHLFDVSTEKLYTIVTNQGDSEVLLVEGSDVYYRVNNRLYQASIAGGAVSAGKVLVEAEEIRDVHWAFIKH